MLCLAAFLFQTFSLILEYYKNPTARRTALKEILHIIMTCAIVYSTFSILGYFCSVISPGNILPRGGPRVQPLQPGDARLQGCAGLRVGQEVRPGQRVGHGEEDSGGGVRGCLQPASARDFLPQWLLLETEREPVQPRPGLARLAHELRGRQVRASNEVGDCELFAFTNLRLKVCGRCLTLDYTQTRAFETALVLKFNTWNFTEGVEVDLKITGRYWVRDFSTKMLLILWVPCSLLMFLDPHRDHYRPDIFSFSGDKIHIDLSQGSISNDRPNRPFSKTLQFYRWSHILSVSNKVVPNWRSWGGWASSMQTIHPELYI